MSAKNRIARVINLGGLLMFSIMNGLCQSFRLNEISYEIVSRLKNPDNGVFLKIEDENPVICANSMKDIKNFFQSFGITELPGQRPCQPNCFRCGSKCLALAA